jgi:hypothetical protein
LVQVFCCVFVSGLGRSPGLWPGPPFGLPAAVPLVSGDVTEHIQADASQRLGAALLGEL